MLASTTTGTYTKPFQIIPWQLANDGVIYQGVPVDMSTFEHTEKLFEKIQQLQKSKSVSAASNKKGETKSMKYAEIMSSLPEDQATVIKTQLETILAEKQEIWDNEKAALEQHITELKAVATPTEDPKVDPVQSKESLEEKMLDSMTEEAREEFLAARLKVKQLELEVAEAKRNAEFASFKQELEAFENLPITEAIQEALFNFKNVDADAYQEVKTTLIAANEAAKDLFLESGSVGKSTATTAYEEIEQKVTALRTENPALDYSEAWAQIIKAEPELYERYKVNQ
jgi:hypothetical protein